MNPCNKFPALAALMIVVPGLLAGCEGTSSETDAATRQAAGNALGLLSTDAAGALEKVLIDLPADTWLELPNSRMRSVCAPDRFGVSGASGCAAVINAWGGGTWSDRRRKLFVFGGGHNDYWGNELYAFDVPSGQWQRLTDPSPGPFNTDPMKDGTPISRHTYGGLAYLDHADRLWVHGGSRARDGFGTGLTWTFDPETREWENRQPKPGGPGKFSLTSQYDPESGQVIVRATQALLGYDYEENRWFPLKGFGYKPEWPRYELSKDKSSALDTRRRLFWSVGSNDFLVWSLEDKKLVSDDWISEGAGEYNNRRRVGRYPDQVLESGGGDIYNARAPGFDYDAQADQMVAWFDGAPYILDLVTKKWRRGSAAGAPARNPKAKGVYGRFAYLPAYNVFILVNSVDENLYFYKNTAGGPTAGGPPVQ